MFKKCKDCINAFKKYKDYKYACLTRRNFIVSQILTFFGGMLHTFILLIAVFLVIGYILPLINTGIAG